MNKTIVKGIVRINNLSFLEFSSELYGYDVVNKHNDYKVPRFILFWKGLTVAEVKNRYVLVKRIQHYDY
jgi:hypothetical protein